MSKAERQLGHGAHRPGHANGKADRSADRVRRVALFSESHLVSGVVLQFGSDTRSPKHCYIDVRTPRHRQDCMPSKPLTPYRANDAHSSARDHNVNVA